MKRGITILLSLFVLAGVAYFTISKWAIRHETIMFTDRFMPSQPHTFSVEIFLMNPGISIPVGQAVTHGASLQ